jgi:hypothetical protein
MSNRRSDGLVHGRRPPAAWPPFVAPLPAQAPDTPAGQGPGAWAHERFVDRASCDLLGRPADSGELLLYAALLGRGAWTRTQVARAILVGVDYRIHLVQRLHRALLGRTAGLPRLMRCVKFLAAGGDVVRLKEMLLVLPEYFISRGGDTHAGFLQALYCDVLERAIRPAELEAETRQLQAGVARGAVVGRVLASAEAHRALVRGWHHQLLRRPADPPPLAAYVGLLGQGKQEEEVLADLVGSDEYFALAQAEDLPARPR